MSINIATRPRSVVWSRNEIEFVFGYFLPSAGDRLYIQIQNAGSLAVYTEVNYPLDTTVTSGFLNLLLQDLMHPVTAFGKPTELTPGISAINIREMGTNIAKFKLRYRAAPPGFPISWTQDSNVLTVIRGGIGDLSRNQEYKVNSSGVPSLPLPRGSRFLTYVPSGRLQAPDEWGWLLYLSLESTALQISYYVTHMDGTSSVFTRIPMNGGNTNMQYRSWYVPTGVDQARLDPFGKGVKLVNIQSETETSPGTWTPVDNYVIYVDHRTNYAPFTLYYRNSVGGWDNLRMRGEHESSSEAERKETGVPLPFVAGRTAWFDASITPKWKLQTGYLSREHMSALDDLLLSTECALLYNEQWLPVRVTSKSLTPISTKAGLLSAELEIETAGAFRTLPNQLSALR